MTKSVANSKVHYLLDIHNFDLIFSFLEGLNESFLLFQKKINYFLISREYMKNYNCDVHIRSP